MLWWRKQKPHPGSACMDRGQHVCVMDVFQYVWERPIDSAERLHLWRVSPRQVYHLKSKHPERQSEYEKNGAEKRKIALSTPTPSASDVFEKVFQWWRQGKGTNTILQSFSRLVSYRAVLLFIVYIVKHFIWNFILFHIVHYCNVSDFIEVGTVIAINAMVLITGIEIYFSVLVFGLGFLIFGFRFQPRIFISVHP